MAELDAIRNYRIRLYDGLYEVMRDRDLEVEVDLGTPGAAGILDRKLAALTRSARILANEPMDHPRMELLDPRNGRMVKEWSHL